MKKIPVSASGEQQDAIGGKLRAAIFFHQHNQIAEASRLYAEILKANPKQFDALQYLAAIHIQSGHFSEAERLFARAIRIDPNSPVLHSNYGSALHALGRYAEAAASYEKALGLDPHYAEAFYNLANSLSALERFDAAIVHYKKAIDINPSYADAHYNLGNALQKLRRFEETIASYDAALSMAPGFALAYLNRGNALREMRRYAEAIADYDKAIQHNSNCSDAFANRGGVLKDLRRFDEALTSYFKALSINPKDPEIYWNTGLMLLLLGNFRDGLEFYEWRKKIKEPLGNRTFPRPLWTGQEDLRGKRILIHEEQGVGDIIQFCRYVKHLEERGAHVIFAVAERLSKLMSTLGESIEIRPIENIVPDFDFHCPLISLPKAFNTDLATIPAHTPYLFADPARNLSLRQQLREPGARKICGVSWFSTNPSTGKERSVKLADLLGMLDAKDYTFVNLHYGDVTQEIADLRAQLGIDVHLVADMDNFRDLDGFAALVDACDVILTIDNTTAHMAGALNKTTFLMLSYVPDWRWMLDREDSPWYPSLRLFRQRSDGDWGPVLRAVNSALKEAAGSA